VLFLIVPSIIFVIWASNRDASPSEAPHASAPETPTDGASSPETEESSDQPLHEYPTGPTSFDPDAGKLTFPFTPESQTALDNNTTTKIGELLTSPKNIPGSKISVEIPQLKDDETGILTTAILDAFEKHEISSSDIVFMVYQPDPDAKTFDINVSFN